MYTTTPGIKRIALLTLVSCILAASFWLFFDISKHNPALSTVNPFAEDPYDSVGSFGIQLAAVSAVLSLIRIIRPYPNGISPYNLTMILRGNIVCLLSIGVTMLANLIALFRYPQVWLHTTSGGWLAGLVVSLLGLTVLTGIQMLRAGKSVYLSSGNQSHFMKIIIGLLGSLLLAFYPPSWQGSISGGILAAVVGMVIFMIVTWVLARGFYLSQNEYQEDILDDLASIYEWIKMRAVFATSVFRMLEKITQISLFKAFTRWLNPRKHPWNIVLLAAFGVGAAMLIAESFVEGAPDRNHILLVMSVVLGIEGLGVVFGYILFRQVLGLFRKE